MPKRTTTAKTGFPVNPEDCYANRHLTGSEYKVYDVMMAFAIAGRMRLHGRDSTQPLYFTASLNPTLVNALAMSVTQTRDMKDRLLKLGWIALHKEGDRRSDGRLTPDTYRVLTHSDFIALHPESCPPYEFAPDFDTAQAYGVRHGQRLRDSGPLPKQFWPIEPVLRSALDKITAEEVSIITDDELTALHTHLAGISARTGIPVLGQNRDSGTGPEPENRVHQHRDSVPASTGIPFAPAPENRFDQHRDSGVNLVTPSLKPNLPTQLTTTTTTTKEGNDFESGGGGSGLVGREIDINTPIVETNLADEPVYNMPDEPEDNIPEEPSWLKQIWAAARDYDGDSVYNKALALRRPTKELYRGVSGISPDVVALDKLIDAELNTDENVQRAENRVRAAWTYFAFNPAPHCKPVRIGQDDQKDATIFPVTVFVANFTSYRDVAIKYYQEHRNQAHRNQWLVTYQESFKEAK